MRKEAFKMRCFGFAAVALVCLSTACQHVENPFRDETIPADSITTATAEGVRSQAGPAENLRRDWPPQRIVTHSGMVTHWPLWWEDPFEDLGSEDNQFAWTWEDAVAFPGTVGRWVVNTGGWPVSAVFIPPGTVMSSDGIASHRGTPRYPFDAEVGPGEPRDIGEAESVTTYNAEISDEPEQAPPPEPE